MLANIHQLTNLIENHFFEKQIQPSISKLVPPFATSPCLVPRLLAFRFGQVYQTQDRKSISGFLAQAQVK
jgi:hypothetical protein